MKTKQLLLTTVIILLTVIVCGMNATAQTQAVSLKPLSNSEANSPASGDVNGDGKVDVADIASVLSAMAGTANDTITALADVNKDGKVDVADIATILSIMAGYTQDKAYSCPDENHPHWIDLGIGTEWRCCNEGASTPEGYGGYYTFDQAQAYNPPSHDQIEALLNNCSSAWTTHNGVNGRKFTGPNGCTIFLPAAGYFWYGETYGVLSDGLYWSSTLYNADYAYYFYFGSADAYSYYSGRGYGRPVRPVRQN